MTNVRTKFWKMLGLLAMIFIIFIYVLFVTELTKAVKSPVFNYPDEAFILTQETSLNTTDNLNQYRFVITFKKTR